MFGSWWDDETKRIADKRKSIQEKAQQKYGGPTSSTKIIFELKRIAQKYNVADTVTIQSGPGKGVRFSWSDKTESRLSVKDKLSDFIKEIEAAVNDCGYESNRSVDQSMDINPV